MQANQKSVPLSEDIVAQYLAVLEVARADSSLAALRELLTAHMTRIPFENISKLYYRRHLGLMNLPEVQLYLEGIKRYHFGGTCYSNNYYFHLLLRSLGYEAKLCAADMRTPEVHAVNMITIEGREYLADTGYAAPLLDPIPRDLDTDYEITLGRDRYVLKPQDENGCSRLELYRDGVLRHGYLARPAARKLEDFSNVIAGSFSADATFLNCLLLARFTRNGSTVIHNFALIQSDQRRSSVHTLANRDELIAAIEHHFCMPPEIVAEAVGELANLQDPWS